MQLRRKRLPLLGGVVVGLVALLMLTATSDCEKWSATGSLPWPTPTVPADPYGVWEESTGWTWAELEGYVGEIAAGMPEVASLPAEGEVLPNGARVLCSNPTTGVYVIELGPLPPPPAPWETDREVTLAELAGQEALLTTTPAPSLNDGDGDLVPPDEEQDEQGDNAVTC